MSDHSRRYSGEYWDHRRDERKHQPRPRDLTFSQIDAISALLASCETLCETGVLGERTEMLLRERIAETLTAFGLTAANRDEREGLAS
jgi:hypothetical protein